MRKKNQAAGALKHVQSLILLESSNDLNHPPTMRLRLPQPAAWHEPHHERHLGEVGGLGDEKHLVLVLSCWQGDPLFEQEEQIEF